MLLVTGGEDSDSQYLASTEVYYPSSGEWREVPGALPRPMDGVGVVTLNNRVLLFGGMIIYREDGHKSLVFKGGLDIELNQYVDILQFSDSEGEENWARVGAMSRPRGGHAHAVSIINFDNFKDFCR